jgi:phage-related holin
MKAMFFSVDMRVHTILYFVIINGLNILLSVIITNAKTSFGILSQRKNYSQMARMLLTLLLIYVMKMIYILDVYE